MSMRCALLSVSLLAAGSLPLLAQEIPNEGPVPTTALIEAQSKGDVPLDPASLKLQVNGHDTPINSVTQVRPSSAQIAILIDEGLRGSFNLQLREIENFVNTLPPGAKVLIGYMENGTVRSTGGFSADHEAVLSSLRIPLSMAGISASPYFCLSDFVKHWPSNERGARVVLMVTNGVDPYNGSTSILNQDSPYVQAAQEDAERAGVAVYSIYYPDAGFRGARGSFSGQSYLQQVAEATGGQSFYQGSIPPVTFAPYLAQFRRAIEESYVVGFMANSNREKNDTLVRIKLKTVQPGVKVQAPEAVHPGLNLQ